MCRNLGEVTGKVVALVKEYREWYSEVKDSMTPMEEDAAYRYMKRGVWNLLLDMGIDPVSYQKELVSRVSGHWLYVNGLLTLI